MAIQKLSLSQGLNSTETATMLAMPFQSIHALAIHFVLMEKLLCNRPGHCHTQANCLHQQSIPNLSKQTSVLEVTACIRTFLRGQLVAEQNQYSGHPEARWGRSDGACHPCPPPLGCTMASCQDDQREAEMSLNMIKNTEILTGGRGRVKRFHSAKKSYRCFLRGFGAGVMWYHACAKEHCWTWGSGFCFFSGSRSTQLPPCL